MKDIVIPQIQKILEKQTYLLWSGGKDSTVLLDMFIDYLNNHEEFKTNFYVVLIPFPISIYSNQQILLTASELESININLNILYPTDDMPHDIIYSEACKKCKLIRRNLLRDFFSGRDMNDAYIVTGHNLSDLLAYYAECIIYKLNIHDDISSSRFLETTNKLQVEYITEEGTIITRPLITVSSQEVNAYFNEHFRSIYSITTQKCPWINQRKRLLQDYFSSSGIVTSYQRVRDSFYQHFDIPKDSDYHTLDYLTYLL